MRDVGKRTPGPYDAYPSRAQHRTMKSYQFGEHRHALQLMDQETPTPQGDEVLVRIRACAPPCRSDALIGKTVRQATWEWRERR